MSGAPRLSCIIPAFNEAPRITAVLETVLATPWIDEVIVVDDGSTDATAEIARGFAARDRNLTLLIQPMNGGKTRAVAAGVAAARGALILLVDADLEGLTPDHIASLAAPVLEGRADAAVSLRRNAPWPWRAIGLDYISGERVLPRALLVAHLDRLDTLPRFGLEVFMNRLWIANGLRIAVVRWPGVSSPLKGAKHGARAGIIADLRMLGDIFQTVRPWEALAQIATLRSRRI
ncbi:Glycosyltransferases involved in cell wall biogenesis [Maritimibacter sp. HL-12]|nr:Glycosyltransferases involved in cell wall biogenesis [Maritimibacter sp. HL-12]